MIDFPKRKRLRLLGYNYSQNGAYFITICTQNRLPLFGELVNGVVVLNHAGLMIEQRLINAANDTVSVEKYCIMPNHIHVIFLISALGGDGGNGTTRGSDGGDGTTRGSFPTGSFPTEAFPTEAFPTEAFPTGSFPTEAFPTEALPTAQATISEIVQRFKTITTKLYIDGVKNGDYPPFNKKIWQKSFYDHIIRNDGAYWKIWQYIDENPLKWKNDGFYNK